MRTKKKALLGAVLGAALLLPPVASVAQQPQANWYVGGSAGQSEFKRTCEGLAIGCDESDSAWRVFAGYQYSRNVAFELGYADAGEAEGAGNIGGQPANFKRKVRAWDLSGLLQFPVGERFGLFGRLGIMRDETKFTGTLLGAPVATSEKHFGWTYGLGAEANFGALGLRAEWQRYATTGGGGLAPFLPNPEDDVDVFSLGLLVRF
ncbi:MAG: outer membrane beta-barrel protein [Burkholderiales bacterium]